MGIQGELKRIRGAWHTRACLLRRIAIVVVLAVVALFSKEASAHRASRQLWLWAWERPEDLRFLSPDVGVAFLAATVDVRGEHAVVLPRRQPLRVLPTTPLIAVVRVERPRRGALRMPDREVVSSVEQIVARVLRLPRVTGLQIDFDARVSERPLYRSIVARLRANHPDTFLSVTALASWCEGDGWIDSLHADEVVPMVFAMGPEGRVIRRSLEEHEQFQQRECRGAMGVAPREGLPALGEATRVYAFSYARWTEDDVSFLERRAL